MRTTCSLDRLGLISGLFFKTIFDLLTTSVSFHLPQNTTTHQHNMEVAGTSRIAAPTSGDFSSVKQWGLENLSKVRFEFDT